jgi:predicted transcriptional regulator
MGRRPQLRTNPKLVMEWLRRQPPLARLSRTTEMIAEWGKVRGELLSIRAEAVRDLRDEGWSVNKIADHLGVTQGRVGQLQNPNYYGSRKSNLTVEEQVARRRERTLMRAEAKREAAEARLSALYAKSNPTKEE